MCANYRPVTRMDRMLTFFGVERDRDEVPVDVFPTGLAPFIRRVDGTRDRQVATGAFSLLPHFATEVAYGRRTYNARSETVRSLPSFKDAWRRSQRCVIPAEAIYEPNYESGRAVRWRISQHGDVPMGVAGIYTQWRQPDGREMFSFAMITESRRRGHAHSHARLIRGAHGRLRPTQRAASGGATTREARKNRL